MNQTQLGRRLAALLFFAFVTVPACAPEGSAERRRNPPAAEAPPAEDDARAVDVARPAFQAKSSAQLARSIEACIGLSALEVTETMILSDTNQKGFLTADFAKGDDIVAVQALLFDGTPASLRTGVRVDQISLEYITALKNVANVVGSRCAEGLIASPEHCACGSDAEARAMLERCLAAVADPRTPEFGALASNFAATCRSNQGTAIASMIASLAFAKVP